MSTIDKTLAEFLLDQSGQGNVEFGKTTKLALAALTIILLLVIAAQNDYIQSLPDQLFHHLRAVASNSQAF